MYLKIPNPVQKSSSDESPTTNQFAPRPFVVQPKVEEIKPQQDQRDDLQPLAEKSKGVDNGFPDPAIFTRHLAPPKKPRIQMKLSVPRTEVKDEREANKVAADIVQQINVPESPSLQHDKLLIDEDKQGKKPLSDKRQPQQLPSDKDLYLLVAKLPKGKIQDAVVELLKSKEDIDKNTAKRLIDGDITAGYIEDLTIPNNVNTMVANYGYPPATFTMYYVPRKITPVIVQKNAVAFADRDTSSIYGLRSQSLESWKKTLVHEINHARNPKPTNLIENYKSEFRAYWVADYRHVTNLNERARQVQARILKDYPLIKNSYDSDPTVKAAIDAHTRPDGNLINQ